MTKDEIEVQNNFKKGVEILRKVLTDINTFRKLKKEYIPLLMSDVHGVLNKDWIVLDSSKIEENDKFKDVLNGTDYPCILKKEGDKITTVKVANENDDLYEFFFDTVKSIDITDDDLNEIMERMETFTYILFEIE